MNDTLTKLKYNFSILAYIFVIYPIKRFIYPVFTILIKESYMLLFIGVGYTLFYLYDWDPQHLATDLANKIINEDIWAIEWFFSPLITIGLIEVSPASLVLVCLGGIIIIRTYLVFRKLYRQFKMVAGDILLVLLWCYYTVAGKKELSVMLISADEAKHKIVMYLIIGLVLILSIIMVFAPNLMINQFVPVNVPSQIILNNTSIETPEYMSLVVP